LQKHRTFKCVGNNRGFEAQGMQVQQVIPSIDPPNIISIASCYLQ